MLEKMFFGLLAVATVLLSSIEPSASKLAGGLRNHAWAYVSNARSSASLAALPSDPDDSAPMSSVSPTPPPTHRPSSTPTISIARRSIDIPGDPLAYPFDFHFAYQLGGVGFKPGEKVTLSVPHYSFSPTTVTADSVGSVVAQFVFTWVFCGPGARRQLAPIFIASGDRGSTASVAEKAPPCPLLAGWEKPKSLPPLPNATETPSIAPFPTVRPAPTATQQGVLPPQPSTTQPTPSLTPVPVLVEGFGFALHATVMLRILSGNSASSESAEVTTDKEGRLRVTREMLLPRWIDCRAVQLVASDGRGVRATASVSRAPNPGGPPAPLVPCVGKENQPAVSLSLRPLQVHAGQVEHLSIRTNQPGTAYVTVRYRRWRTSHKVVRIRRSGRTVVRWLIPRTAPLGLARVRSVFQPGNISLVKTFAIR